MAGFFLRHQNALIVYFLQINICESGHDFFNGNWLSGLRYGVREAVHEFCVVEGWEFVFLTMEIGDNPSFAIRKMK